MSLMGQPEGLTSRQGQAPSRKTAHGRNDGRPNGDAGPTGSGMTPLPPPVDDTADDLIMTTSQDRVARVVCSRCLLQAPTHCGRRAVRARRPPPICAAAPSMRCASGGSSSDAAQHRTGRLDSVLALGFFEQARPLLRAGARRNRGCRSPSYMGSMDEPDRVAENSQGRLLIALLATTAGRGDNRCALVRCVTGGGCR